METCSVNQCDRPVLRRQLCNGHYLRQLRGRPLDSPIRLTLIGGRPCRYPECELRTTKGGAHGYCRKHRQAFDKYKKSQLLVDMLGGRCGICKKKYPAVAFDLHHRDPRQKRFTIAKEIKFKSMEELIAEARKCDLLCANCHRILHWGKSYEIFRRSVPNSVWERQFA